MRAALRREADGQRALLAGDGTAAAAAFRAAATLYRASWEAAPSGSYGSLLGMLKASVLAGDAREGAGYARAALGDRGAGSPSAAYVRALIGLIAGDRDGAVAWATRMRCGSSAAFDRTAEAILALARGDAVAYGGALRAIVCDFEQRTDHLTGVAIADTAVMLQRLAGDHGVHVELSSDLLPAAAV